MTIRKAFLALALFTGGALFGGLYGPVISPAQAGDTNWATVADDPEFRAAVIKVIDSCLVDNAMIYCN